jgi:RNA polymerase sigma-70 factor (ECF subfamily)
MWDSFDRDRERRRLLEGGSAALAEVFSECRDRLERVVEFRLDPRLRGRVDAADVVQEAYLEVARRAHEYMADPAVSFFVWVRQLTFQTLINIHRRHFREKRDPSLEVRLGERLAHSTSDSIARQLVEARTTPSQAAARAEELALVRAALESMDEIDREVLALRHFEQLGNNEVAEVLGLSVTAASNRYVRAIKRLGEIMAKATKDE